MPKDWDSAKPHIRRLYMEENRALSEVVRLMRIEYGFKASVRAYRMRLSDWDYQKKANRKASERQQATLNSKSSDIKPLQQIGEPDMQQSQNTKFSPLLGLRRTRSPSHASVTTDVSRSFSPTASHASTHDVQVQSDTSTPLVWYGSLQHLHQAIKGRSVKGVADCLSCNMELATQRDFVGNAPIHYAAIEGSGDLISPLIMGGADINATDRRQRTPLHLALKSTKTIRDIISFNPTISPQDAYGNTPLHLSVQACNMNEPLEGSAMESLIRAGADVNATNRWKESPFCDLINKLPKQEKHQISYMLLFLENKADIDSYTVIEEPVWSFLMRNTEFRWTGSDINIPSCSRNQDLKFAFSRCTFKTANSTYSKCIIQNALSSGILDDGHDYELGKILCHNAPILFWTLAGENVLHCLLKMANDQAFQRYEECLRILLHRTDWNTWYMTNELGQTPLETLFCNERSTTEAKLKLLKIALANLEIVLWPDSENLPIYTAAALGKAGEPIVNFILEDGRQKFHSYRFNSRSYWVWYYKFIEDGRYLALEEWYENSTDFFPANICDDMRSLSCAYAAQQLLINAARGYKEGLIFEEKIVPILRICRKFKIKVELYWYEYLLDLFD